MSQPEYDAEHATNDQPWYQPSFAVNASLTDEIGFILSVDDVK